MLPIPIYIPTRKDDLKCGCGAIEETRYIYICEYWNNQSEQIEIEINMIYTDDMPKKVKVYRQFEVHYKRREEYKPHVIHHKDPLSSIIIDNSNGNKN